MHARKAPLPCTLRTRQARRVDRALRARPLRHTRQGDRLCMYALFCTPLLTLSVRAQTVALGTILNWLSDYLVVST